MMNELSSLRVIFSTISVFLFVCGYITLVRFELLLKTLDRLFRTMVSVYHDTMFWYKCLTYHHVESPLLL